MTTQTTSYQQKQVDEVRHYLGAILVLLRTLYELTEKPNVREQISDAISWLQEQLGVPE